MKKVIVAAILLSIVLAAPLVLRAGGFEKAVNLYEQGVRTYDLKTLENALHIIRRLRGKKEYMHHLGEGLILQRLQFVQYVAGNTNKVKEYGRQAERALLRAEKSNPDSIEPVIYRGLVYLFMARGKGKDCLMYGAQSKRIATVCLKAYPDHLLARILDGAVRLELPRALGGDINKAVSVFVALRMEYPQSEDVRVLLGKAYAQAGRFEEAFGTLKSVLKRNPDNRLAQLLLSDILTRKMQ
ncbi:MAG: tetratricopeptide repeat protein [bacterium]|nr:tetratricopeptide repeat protein [bacterium]